MTAINLTRANFEAFVLHASVDRPVLVDFWAPWCAPCRALSPVLERVAAEFADRMILVKLNTESEPELAAHFRVRGIPNCKLFVNGVVVDEFTGLLSEAAIRDFLKRALPSPAATIVAAAKELIERNELQEALAKLDEAQAIDPDSEDMLLTRIEALLALDRLEDARTWVGHLDAPAPRNGHPVRDTRRLAGIKARLALADDSGADLDLATLSQRAATHPVDCDAKLAYARALAASGDYEQALQQLLAVVRTDRKFGNDIGRRTMLTVFEALPGDSDLVRRYRRELAAALN